MSRPGTTLLALTVVAVDLALKACLTTPDWAVHRQTHDWRVTAALGLLIPTAMMLYRPTALGGAFLLAGVLGNLLDSLGDGAVLNPLVLRWTWVNPFASGTPVAFNLADVSLLVGGVLVVCATPWVTRDLLAKRRRIA